jgi:hypothetical protein
MVADFILHVLNIVARQLKNTAWPEDYLRAQEEYLDVIRLVGVE